MPAKKESFEAYLTRLREARARADAALAQLPPEDELARRTLRLAWALLYDFLCLHAGELKPAQLRQIGDLVLKFARARQAAQTRRTDAPEVKSATAGLPEDLRAVLERELGLMA